MINRTQIERDRTTNAPTHRIKHSQCLLSIRDFNRSSALENISIDIPKKRDLLVPTFSIVHVQKYNPVIQAYYEFPIGKQELVAPPYRNPASRVGLQRYFQGISIAFVPREVMSTESFPTVHSVPAGFEFNKGEKILGNVLFYPFLLEQFFPKEEKDRKVSLGVSAEVHEESGLSLCNSLRRFFRDPQPLWIKYLGRGSELCGYFKFPLDFASQMYFTAVKDIAARFSVSIPVNSTGFQFE